MSHPRDPASETEVRFRHSPSFSDVLEQAGCSVLVSTYQAGQLIAVGRDSSDSNGLHLSFRAFDQAMGVAVGDGRMAVGARGQVWLLGDHSALAPAIEPAGRYDRCWLPSSSRYTGGIQVHEMAWGRSPEGAEPDLWVVNTLFSCLASVSLQHHFTPRWRPPFISRLAPEDRCHLNGLAMRGGLPAYVTVMAPSDEPAGWRAARNDTGAVLEVPTGEVVTQGLAMPHSPRWHDGQLFVLNSGMGRLELVDVDTGKRAVVALLPGYARGLAFHGNLAFVGLSRIRESAVFGGAPIAEYHDQLTCGVGVIDLRTGDTVATLEFDTGVEEIFDVQVLPGTRCATFGGAPGSGEEIWLVPEE